MLDLTKTNLPIKHRSEGVPGIARMEKYQLEDITYTEMYDGLSDKLVFGHITMYGDVKVGTVYPDGLVSLSIPTNWVTNHKKMMQLMDDLKRLDEFLSVISDHYNK